MTPTTVKSSIGDKAKGTHFECDTIVNLPDTLNEAFEVWGEAGVDPEATALKIIRAAWKQNATQGPKEGLREAAQQCGNDFESEVFTDALSTYHDATGKYIYTGKRRASDGITQQAAQSALRAQRDTLRELDDDTPMTVGDYKAMLAEHGVPMD